MLYRACSRLLWAVVSIWAVVTLAFFVSHALPSDPARSVAGPQARPADVARIRAELGLDEAVTTQYRRFLEHLVHAAPNEPSVKEHASCQSFGLLHLDLGMSYQRRRPVITVLVERFPRTLYLAMAALFVQVPAGVLAGVLAATRRKTAWDHGAIAVTLVLLSAPTFLTGTLLQYIFAYRLRWLPLDGFGQTAQDHVISIVLPALTLGLAGAAYYTRIVRSDMINALGQDYMRTARAKGATPFAVIARHGLRNALLPLITLVGLDFGVLVGGAIVTEKLFRWPGVGQLSVDAVFDRDTPIIMGIVILTSTAIVLANIVVDLAHAWLDPRVRSR